MISKKNLNKICLKPDDTILKVIRVLEKFSTQIIFVVKNEKLIGTITDGDVRRHILKNFSLDVRVIEIMNKKPVWVSNTEREIVLKNKILSGYNIVPICDKKKRILSYYSIRDLVNKKSFDTNKKENFDLIIMAGGYGKRLRPLTKNIPKPLIKIGRKTILERVIENSAKYHPRKVFILVHYKYKKIIKTIGDGSKYNLKIEYILEKKPLGTAGGLSLVKNKIKNNFFVINADVLIDLNLNSVFEYKVKNKCKSIICSKYYSTDIPYGVTKIDKKSNLISLEEKPKINMFINAGIYLFEKSIFKEIVKKKFKYYGMDELIKNLLNKKEKIKIFPLHEKWFDIGSHENLKLAKNDFKKK